MKSTKKIKPEQRDGNAITAKYMRLAQHDVAIPFVLGILEAQLNKRLKQVSKPCNIPLKSVEEKANALGLRYDSRSKVLIESYKDRGFKVIVKDNYCCCEEDNDNWLHIELSW